MKNQTNLVVMIASLLLTAATAPVVAGTAPVMVQLSLDDIWTKEPVVGNVFFDWGNQTVTVPVALATGEKLYASRTFTNVSLSDGQRVRLVSALNETLLAASMAFDGGSLRLVSGSVDETKLKLNREDASVSLVVGSVTGELHFRFVFRERAANVTGSPSQVALVAIDRDADGVLEADEWIRVVGEGNVVTGSLRAVDVPPTSAWGIAAEVDGVRTVAYHGVLSWVSGAFITTELDQLDPATHESLMRIEAVALRETISGIYEIPNSALVRTWNATEAPGKLPEYGLSLSFGNQSVEKQALPPGGAAGPAELDEKKPPRKFTFPSELSGLVLAAGLAALLIGVVAFFKRKRATRVEVYEFGKQG